MMVLFGIILALLGGFGKALRDTLAHHFETSVFRNLNPQFWNPVLSGSNKWKNGDRAQGEKFKFSSTLLISLTEAWHIGETINVAFLILGTGLLVYSGIGLLWALLLARIAYGISFTVLYKLFNTERK